MQLWIKVISVVVQGSLLPASRLVQWHASDGCLGQQSPERELVGHLWCYRTGPRASRGMMWFCDFDFLVIILNSRNIVLRASAIRSGEYTRIYQLLSHRRIGLFIGMTFIFFIIYISLQDYCGIWTHQLTQRCLQQPTYNPIICHLQRSCRICRPDMRLCTALDLNQWSWLFCWYVKINYLFVVAVFSESSPRGDWWMGRSGRWHIFLYIYNWHCDKDSQTVLLYSPLSVARWNRLLLNLVFRLNEVNSYTG